MFSYILQVTLCWSAFYLLYLGLLRKETFFQVNRWYLVSTLAIGLLIPFIEWQPSPVIEDHPTYTIAIEPIQLQMGQLEQSIEAASQSSILDWTDICLAIYLSGMLFFVALLLHGLWKIWKLYRAGEVEQQGQIKVVYTAEAHLPFSFFNYLFWSKHFEAEHKEKAQILRHEEAHIHQWHTLDVLFLELLNILFWCSPIIYFYRKSLRTTHEYLADALVLQDTKRKEYGRLLLKQSLSGIQIALANHFIHSQLKNRILMMTRNKSRKRNLMKYLPFLPILLLAILVFSKHDGRVQVEKAVASLMEEKELNTEIIETHLIKLSEIYQEFGCCNANPNPPYQSFNQEYSIFIHSHPEDKEIIAELTQVFFAKKDINVNYTLNDNGKLSEITFSDGTTLDHESSSVGWTVYFDENNKVPNFENTFAKILEMHLKNYQTSFSSSAKEKALTAFEEEHEKWLRLYPNQVETINQIANTVKNKSNIKSILDGKSGVTFNSLYLQVSNAKNGQEQIDAFQEFTDFLDDLYDEYPENPLMLINVFTKEGYKLPKEKQLPIEYRIDDKDRIIAFFMAGEAHLKLHKGGNSKFLKIYESDFVITHSLDNSPSDKGRTSDFNFNGDSPNGTNWSAYEVLNLKTTFNHDADHELFTSFSDGIDKRLVYTNNRVESRFASTFREEKASTRFIHPIKDPSKITREMGYGMRMHPIFKKRQLHTGVDYVVPMNTEIVATADGKVIAVKNWQKGYGLHLSIEHKNGYATFYAHLEKSLVKVGQSVKQGDVIALSGNTGTSTGPHLHYEIRKNGEAIDFEKEEIKKAKGSLEKRQDDLEITVVASGNKKNIQKGTLIEINFTPDLSEQKLESIQEELKKKGITLSFEEMQHDKQGALVYLSYKMSDGSGSEMSQSGDPREDDDFGFYTFYDTGALGTLPVDKEEKAFSGLQEFARQYTEYDLEVIESNFEAVFRDPNLTLEDRNKMFSEDYRWYINRFEEKKEEIENSLRRVVFMRGFSVEISDDREVYLYKKDKETTKTDVDEMPRFPSKECEALKSVEAKRNCSNQALIKYIYTNIKYPAGARKAGTEGINLVRFKVMQDGSLEDIRLLKDIGHGCGEEAKRVIEKMNEDNLRWVPGKKDGENIAVEFTIPVNFKLTDDPPRTEGEELFKVVEQMPRFPSEKCEQLTTDEEKRKCSSGALMEYLFKNIKYTKVAKDEGKEGMCVVQFVVEKDGSLSEIKLLRDIGYGLGEESKRVIEKMNEDGLRWIAGMQRGRKVRVQFNLPIRFALTDDRKGSTTEKFDPTPKLASQKLQLTNFNIAPNPSNGELRLRFAGTARPIVIKVYDTNGKILFEEQVQNFDGNYNQQIEVKSSGGIHFLTIEQEGKVFVEQLMIE